MDTHVYRYEFGKGVPMDDVEDTLMLSALAVECLHGRTQLRLDAAFRLDKEHNLCRVDARSAVGQSIARIFTGFLSREFGEHAFTIRKEDAPLAMAAETHSVAGGVQ